MKNEWSVITATRCGTEVQCLKLKVGGTQYVMHLSDWRVSRGKSAGRVMMDNNSDGRELEIEYA